MGIAVSMLFALEKHDEAWEGDQAGYYCGHDKYVEHREEETFIPTLPVEEGIDVVGSEPKKG